MSRWRPPSGTSTPIITRPGFERLRAELDELWRVRRPEVVKALAAAAAEGDRSENAEYTYRKKQLGEIDRRVRYLTKRIAVLKIADGAPSDPGAIWFGARVVLEDDDGHEHAWRIVGPDETDAKTGAISIDSPLARALLRRRAGDEVAVELPGGVREYVVLAIAYVGEATTSF